MTYEQVMSDLEQMGTDQNRKIYLRHGASDNMFGVSLSNLAKLQKRIKTDHDLAIKLWESGNEDARQLAVKVADPLQMSADDLDNWVKDIDYYFLVDTFVHELVSKGPHGRSRLEAWIDADNEWIERAGWMLLANLATYDRRTPDGYFESYIPRIQSGIHDAKNRVRDAMNSALIAIGGRSASLRESATAAAQEIGKVKVDHGETSCKTPDAAQYIAKIWERKAQVAREIP